MVNDQERWYSTMKFRELRESQKLAVELILHKEKCLLTNPCGTGKTLIALKAASIFRDKKVLVVCKASKKQDWKDECQYVEEFKDIEIVSFESVHKISYKPNFLIVDESQNMGQWSTRKGRKIIHLAKNAKRVLFLSATPSMNKPLDWYWPLKLFGEYKRSMLDFKFEFCGAFRLPGKLFAILGKPTNQKRLKKLIDKIVINTSNTRKVEVSSKIVWFKIEQPTNIEFEELAEERKRYGLEKFEIFKRYYKKFPINKRAIFFTRHREVTQGIAKLLNCNYIIGGMNTTQRIKNLYDFNCKKDNNLVISIDAGSEGLNILDCENAYFLEIAYSPKKHEQAILRLVRSEDDKKLNITYFLGLNEHTHMINVKKEAYFKELGI